MSKEEFAKFAMFLKTLYPRENVLPNEAAMEIWFRMLKHINYDTAIAVLQKWAVNNKWPPTIAEIIAESDVITQGEEPTWQEGWKEITRAIGRYGYMDEDGALSSMTETTRKCVQYIGWKNICMSENAVAERANFRSCYEVIQKREKEQRQMPPELKERLSKLQIGAKANGLLSSWKPGDEKEFVADSSESQN